MLSDPILLGEKLDGILFLVGLGKGSRMLAPQATRRIKATGVDLLGIICNQVNFPSRLNDYGYEYIFSRLLKAKGKKGDILIGMSTSGNSKNIVEAFAAAKELGVKSVGWTGAKSCLMDSCDVLLKVPSADTPRIQETQMLIGHIICEIIEKHFVENPL
jgi:D-sedoheptulose 7-phosphate isomerase